MPQVGHAIRRENSRSPPSSVLMTTMSSASLSARSIESDSRRSMPAFDDQPIDEHVDRVVLPPIELDLVVERHELAVDARAREPARPQRGELPLELALAAAHDRRQHVDALVGRIEHHHVDDALERLRRDLAVAVRAVRHADVGEEQAQVVVDLGDRADGRSRVGRRSSSARSRWPATGRRSDRRPASPSARGTAGRRPTATRRSAAALRRRWCRRPARTCPSRRAR